MIVRFLLTRLVRAAAVLVGVMLITFLLIHAIPGSPWNNYSTTLRALSGQGGDSTLQRELDRRYGLDLPLWRQFTRYMLGDFDQDGSFFCGAVCGNLGPSTQQSGRSVENILFSPQTGKTFWDSRFGYSIRLVLLGSLIAAGLGIPLGIWSGAKPGSTLSRVVSVSLAGLVSIPNFVLGLLAIIVLASWLKVIRVLPDWNDPSNWIIPAIVLAAMPMANIARVTRSSIENILNEDYIRTARGKGLNENRVILVHMLGNALVPVITFLGPTFIEMLAGLLIVEYLYSFPGIGRGYWEAVLKLDYPMILGLTLTYAAGMMLINVLIEFFCEMIDPRIRSSARPSTE